MHRFLRHANILATALLLAYLRATPAAAMTEVERPRAEKQLPGKRNTTSPNPTASSAGAQKAVSAKPALYGVFYYRNANYVVIKYETDEAVAEDRYKLLFEEKLRKSWWAPQTLEGAASAIAPGQTVHLMNVVQGAKQSCTVSAVGWLRISRSMGGEAGPVTFASCGDHSELVAQLACPQEIPEYDAKEWLAYPTHAPAVVYTRDDAALTEPQRAWLKARIAPEIVESHINKPGDTFHASTSIHVFKRGIDRIAVVAVSTVVNEGQNCGGKDFADGHVDVYRTQGSTPTWTRVAAGPGGHLMHDDFIGSVISVDQVLDVDADGALEFLTHDGRLVGYGERTLVDPHNENECLACGC